MARLPHRPSKPTILSGEMSMLLRKKSSNVICAACTACGPPGRARLSDCIQGHAKVVCGSNIQGHAAARRRLAALVRFLKSP